MPNCGENDNTSSPETKLLLMLTTAKSISISSTSLIIRLLDTFIGVLFSVYEVDAGSMVESTGASLTSMISISLDSGLLLFSPSLTMNSIVRLASEGLLLMFWYVTERNTVSYSDNSACPFKLSSPVTELKLPLIPNCELKDNKSSLEAKPLIMLIVAECICVLSRSLIARLPVIPIGGLFSM